MRLKFAVEETHARAKIFVLNKIKD